MVERRLVGRFVWGHSLCLLSAVLVLVSSLRPLGALDLGYDGYWRISAWRGVGGTWWAGSWLVMCAACAAVIEAFELCRGLLLPRSTEAIEAPPSDEIRLSIGMVVMHAALSALAALVVWAIVDSHEAQSVTISLGAWVLLGAAVLGVVGSLVTWRQPARVVSPGPLAQLASAPA